MTAQRVFISHSHKDRDIAVQLDNILKKHQAETFLDQDRIEVGDVLPARLENGIKWCSKFLLLGPLVRRDRLGWSGSGTWRTI